jgi:hypothetical protein
MDVVWGPRTLSLESSPVSATRYAPFSLLLPPSPSFFTFFLPPSPSLPPLPLPPLTFSQFDVNKPKRRAIADVSDTSEISEISEIFATGDQKPSAKVLAIDTTGSFTSSGLYWAGLRASLELTDNPVRGSLPAFSIEVKAGAAQIVRIEMDPLEIKSGAKTTVAPHVRVAVVPAQKVPVETNISRYLKAYADISSCQKKTPLLSDKCVSYVFRS